MEELDADSVEEWTDGSRIELRRVSCQGDTAEIRLREGYIRERGLYPRTMATVADAEAVGVMLAWEDCDTIGPKGRYRACPRWVKLVAQMSSDQGG